MTNNEYKERLKKAHLEWHCGFGVLATVVITANFLDCFEQGVWSVACYIIHYLLFRLNTIKNMGVRWAQWILFSTPVVFIIGFLAEAKNTKTGEVVDLLLGILLISSAVVFYLIKVAAVLKLNREISQSKCKDPTS